MNEDAINELLKRGIKHHEAGEVVEARNVYLEILERDPQNHQALDLAGLLCMQCDELDAAADFFSSAIELDPDSGRYLCHAGTLELHLGHFEKAGEFLKKAIASDTEISESFLSLALVYRAQNKTGDAITVLEDGISHDPDNSRLLTWRGILEIDREDLPSAAEFLHQAISADNKNIEAMMHLGNVMMELDELEIAERCYVSVKERSPGDIGTRCRLSVLLKRMGKRDESVKELEAAFVAAPAESDTFNEIALMLESLGNDDDAIVAAERAVALDSGDAASFKLLARLHNKAGNVEAAKDAEEQAAALS